MSKTISSREAGQSRRRRKENKAVVLCESPRLGPALRDEVVYFFTASKRCVGHPRKRDPFASISTRPAGLLRTLQQAIETANQDLAATTLVQLAEEIEQAEETGRAQNERARRSYALSVLGLLLTATFGLISLLLFIYPLIHGQTSR
ncbi:MAG: hypothetical protein ABSC21_03510 [Terriglobia bacterium]